MKGWKRSSRPKQGPKGHNTYAREMKRRRLQITKGQIHVGHVPRKALLQERIP